MYVRDRWTDRQTPREGVGRMFFQGRYCTQRLTLTLTLTVMVVQVCASEITYYPLTFHIMRVFHKILKCFVYNITLLYSLASPGF